MGWTIRDSASSGASPSPTLSWADSDSPAPSWAEARAAASRMTAVSASRIEAQHNGDPPPCVQYEFLHACRVVNARTLASRQARIERIANESRYILVPSPGPSAEQAPSLNGGDGSGNLEEFRDPAEHSRTYFRVACRIKPSWATLATSRPDRS